MAATTRARATEADLLAQPKDGNIYELVDGEIRMSPGGARHSLVAVELAARLLAFVKDRPRYVLDKVGEYLEAGVRLVWVIDPRKGKAVVYRSLSDVSELGPDDVFDGADVLPGFSCRLPEIL